MLLFKAGKGIESAAENGFNPYATRILRFVAIIPSGHTHATILLANNIDVVAVAHRMGHSDPTVTLRTYAHALTRRDQDAAQTFERLFGDVDLPPIEMPLK